MPENIKVFVHLAENKDVVKWKQAYIDGSLAGRNDITPYGYGMAINFGCEVIFSQNHSEGIVGKLIRYSFRLLLGFDIIHAFRNRQKILNCDVIWTHTESQSLAVSAILYFRKTTRPKIIGQSVWLIDGWPKISPIRRMVYRKLIEKIDVLTFLSPTNTRVAKNLFPENRVEFIKFGIVTDSPKPPKHIVTDNIKIISVGNDRHRDWDTIASAVNGRKDMTLRIVSSTANKAAYRRSRNIVVKPALTNDELNHAYDAADVAVVCLKPNLHASGITAVLEGILAGLPVIATDVGGLSSYFNDDEVTYVPLNDSDAIVDAIKNLSSDAGNAIRMARKAQKKTIEQVGLANYIQSHVELSREILSKK